jgi:hypothetical protein
MALAPAAVACRPKVPAVHLAPLVRADNDAGFDEWTVQKPCGAPHPLRPGRRNVDYAVLGSDRLRPPQEFLMFYLFKKPPPVELSLSCWARHMGRFSKVAGYTSFGDVFLLDPDSGQYAVLCPISGERFPTDVYDRDTFRDEFLTDPGIIERFARPDDVAALEKRLGKLKQEEVYIPAPLPFLGGSGALSEYAKGGLWTFLEMVGLFRGLGGGVEVQVKDGTATIVIQREADPPPARPKRSRKRRKQKPPGSAGT